MNRLLAITTFCIILISVSLPVSNSMVTLLSDLPTPCFVLDMKILRQNLSSSPQFKKESYLNNNRMPTLSLEKYGLTLVPTPFNGSSKESDSNSDSNSVMASDDFDDEPLSWGLLPGNSMTSGTDVGIGAFAYVHASVVRSKEDDNSKSGPEYDNEEQHSSPSTFLAQTDLTTNFLPDEEGIGQEQKRDALQLVLELNNHHTGSYYWARAAGKGSSMEAPGVKFVAADGTLRWQEEGGFVNCNSNDGKRSEWVNFLRKGDTVQMVPFDSSIGEDILMEFAKEENTNDYYNCARVFGISLEGRPMGSEPAVICQWKCSQ